MNTGLDTVSKGKADRSGSLSKTDERILKTMCNDLIIRVEENRFRSPEFEGKDAYLAHAAEVPGLTVCAATKEEAKAALLEQIAENWKAADPDRRSRLLALTAHVQFNNRITRAQKAHITERAAQAGMSVRQFFLNQCLYAPINDRESGQMTPEQEDRLWQGTMEAAVSRQTKESRNQAEETPRTSAG